MAEDTNSAAERYYAENTELIKERIERVMQLSPSGSINRAIGNTFYGLNHRHQPGAVPINRDYYGYTFFTRPRMNLSSGNLRQDRLFNSLNTKNSESIPRIIRCLLDPTLERNVRLGISSPFVDPQQAFIPILSNNLISLSGWPDVEALTFTSAEGIYKEAYSFVDSVVKNRSTFDLTANFRSIVGDPITTLFFIWLHYMANTYLGTMVPHPDAIIDHEIDSNTRIYRLVMDHSKTYVQAIAATGAAFPITCPMGAKFNFESDRPMNYNEQITISFRCMGAEYQDEILIDEFNRTVYAFNDTMNDRNRTKHYVKVPAEALEIFNHRGYPHINPDTMELEWWVSKREYSERLPLLSEKQQILSNGG